MSQLLFWQGLEYTILSGRNPWRTNWLNGMFTELFGAESKMYKQHNFYSLFNSNQRLKTLVPNKFYSHYTPDCVSLGVIFLPDNLDS